MSAHAEVQDGNVLTRLPRTIANAFVTRPLRALDRGEVFQIFYTLLLRIAAVLVVAGGMLWMLAYIFVDNGWWDRLEGSSNFLILRSVAAMPLAGLVALATLLVVGGILWTRAADLRSEEYTGLIGIFLRLLKVTGEVYSVLPISTALTLFVSALFGARPYAPLAPGVGTMNRALSGLTDAFRALLSATSRAGTAPEALTLGDWLSNVGGALLGLVLSIFVAISILAFFYLLAEVFGLVYFFLMRKPMFERADAPRTP